MNCSIQRGRYTLALKGSLTSQWCFCVNDQPLWTQDLLVQRFFVSKLEDLYLELCACARQRSQDFVEVNAILDRYLEEDESEEKSEISESRCPPLNIPVHKTSD